MRASIRKRLEAFEQAASTRVARPLVIIEAMKMSGVAAGGPGPIVDIRRSRSLELSRYYDQQADRAHRRFLASVESLARVRRLITPLQINIAEQQVNVAGNVTTGKDRGQAA